MYGVYIRLMKKGTSVGKLQLEARHQEHQNQIKYAKIFQQTSLR